MSATSHPSSSGEPKEVVWREWLAIGVGLTGIVSVVALILALVAIAGGSSSPAQVSMATPSASVAGAGGAAGAVTATPVARTIKMSFKADDEHGRKGPNGVWHDAAVPAIFSVHAGQKITVVAYNYDGAPHSFTDPMIGVNKVLPKGSMSHPSETKFTFTAPSTPGRYPWWCVFPCDPWAMSHNGYMRGYVTVTD